MHFEWNNIGDILAVQIVTEKISTLSLYSCRNYKWDLKQQFCFGQTDELISFHWMSSEQSHIALQVITSTKELKYFFNWAVDTTIWLENREHGTIAVIDGKTLRLTDIGSELQPPPISTFKHVYPDAINLVKYSPSGQFMVVVLCDNTAYISNGSGRELFKISLNKIVEFNYPLSVNNFRIDDDVNLYFVNVSENNSCMYRISKPIENTINLNEHVTKICSLETYITHISLCGSLIFIRTNENISIYNTYEKSFTDSNRWSPPVGQISTLNRNNNNYVFSLSESSFYVNKSLVMNNITSYIVMDNYIMITTSEDNLLCYELNLKDLEKLQNGLKDNIFVRPIPKGAILITAIPNSTSIVLQLERGDLEVIKPRILSVRLVNKLLHEKQFTDAFFVVKHDRLNTNILFDLNQELFFDNIQEFVKSFTDCESLNIFITGLEDDNIVDKLYKNCIPNNKKIISLPKKKKIVLNKLIETMLTIEHRLFLQSIITANIMLNSYEGTENAVKELKWGLLQQETNNSFSIDDVFHRIVPLTSSEDLLKAALSVQDFKLIQWIANKTQLDPLEYIPFFKELSKMEPNFKSFKINNYLKRYDVAFENLIKCDHVETEIVQLLEKADLYKLAVLCTSPENQWYSLVIEKCANHLSDDKKYTEAGILFRKIDKYILALECFIEDGNVEEFFKLVDVVKHKNKNIIIGEHYQRLLKKLINAGKMKEAAHVYESLNDYEESISLLINNKDWNEAIKYILKYNRKDFIG